MVEVEPLIGAATARARERQIEALLRSGCRVVHLDGSNVDPVDAVGLLAPLVHRYDGVLDVHAPAGGFSLLAAAGADSVTFDASRVGDPASAIDEARAAGIQIGIAPDDPTVAAEAVRLGIDLVHLSCTGDQSVANVAGVAKTLTDGVVIQVAGDVTHDNMAALRRAGARLFVVGEPIFQREDLPRAYRRLVQALT
jgi:pentose-5-phosphate-3-epimerase